MFGLMWAALRSNVESGGRCVRSIILLYWCQSHLCRSANYEDMAG